MMRLRINAYPGVRKAKFVYIISAEEKADLEAQGISTKGFETYEKVVVDHFSTEEAPDGA